MTVHSNGDVAIEHREHRNNPSNNSGDSVDRIRDIIFGEQIQDYGSKFEKIWAQFSALDQRLERINEKLAEHERDIDSQLENQKKKIETALNQLDSDFTQQLADAAVENQQRAEALSKSVVTLDKSTKTNLKKATEQLTTLKMDRAALGDLFVSMGQNLITVDSQQETSTKLPKEESSTKSSSNKSSSKKKVAS